METPKSVCAPASIQVPARPPASAIATSEDLSDSEQPRPVGKVSPSSADFLFTRPRQLIENVMNDPSPAADRIFALKAQLAVFPGACHLDIDSSIDAMLALKMSRPSEMRLLDAIIGSLCLALTSSHEAASAEVPLRSPTRLEKAMSDLDRKVDKVTKFVDHEMGSIDSDDDSPPTKARLVSISSNIAVLLDEVAVLRGEVHDLRTSWDSGYEVVNEKSKAFKAEVAKHFAQMESDQIASEERLRQERDVSVQSLKTELLGVFEAEREKHKIHEQEMERRAEENTRIQVERAIQIKMVERDEKIESMLIQIKDLKGSKSGLEIEVERLTSSVSDRDVIEQHFNAVQVHLRQLTADREAREEDYRKSKAKWQEKKEKFLDRVTQLQKAVKIGEKASNELEAFKIKFAKSKEHGADTISNLKKELRTAKNALRNQDKKDLLALVESLNASHEELLEANKSFASSNAIYEATVKQLSDDLEDTRRAVDASDRQIGTLVSALVGVCSFFRFTFLLWLIVYRTSLRGRE